MEKQTLELVNKFFNIITINGFCCTDNFFDDYDMYFAEKIPRYHRNVWIEEAFICLPNKIIEEINEDYTVNTPVCYIYLRSNYSSSILSEIKKIIQYNLCLEDSLEALDISLFDNIIKLDMNDFKKYHKLMCFK